jgi:tetratricopeptide (TPR) repeat protein
LGYAYEKKKDYQKAISYFELISENDDPVIKDVALFNQGRLYEALGDVSKSRDAFNRLVLDYADSIYFEIAKEKVSG